MPSRPLVGFWVVNKLEYELKVHRFMSMSSRVLQISMERSILIFERL